MLKFSEGERVALEDLYASFSDINVSFLQKVVLLFKRVFR